MQDAHQGKAWPLPHAKGKAEGKNQKLSDPRRQTELRRM